MRSPICRGRGEARTSSKAKASHGGRKRTGCRAIFAANPSYASAMGVNRAFSDALSLVNADARIARTGLQAVEGARSGRLRFGPLLT